MSSGSVPDETSESGQDVDRAQVLDQLNLALRDQAGRGLMLHGAIADRFGLNFTDLKCLDLARFEPELTAGRIAAVTGLSTSAVTSVLDRLEKRGFINRQRDPNDRRKVVVVSTGKQEAEVGEIFARLGAMVGTVLADYDTDQLAMILGFLRRLDDTAQHFTEELTAAAPKSR